MVSLIVQAGQSRRRRSRHHVLSVAKVRYKAEHPVCAFPYLKVGKPVWQHTVHSCRIFLKSDVPAKQA